MENNKEGCCQEKMCSKSDSLLYHTNLCPETVEKMRQCRAKFVTLAREMETLGNSREMSECFTKIESAQMYAIKHLCMVCPTAVRVGLDEDCSNTPSWQSNAQPDAAAM